MTNTQLLNKTIQSLGILKRYKGYKQLMMSVELALDDEERLMYITENIYNPVADMCCCNRHNIERNIRTVAEHAWENHSERLTEIAGYDVVATPSVSELISILVTYVERNSTDN